MKYQIEITNLRTKERKTVGPFAADITALNEALKYKRRGFNITITRDSEGADHPANAGKFFLHKIVA